MISERRKQLSGVVILCLLSVLSLNGCGTTMERLSMIGKAPPLEPLEAPLTKQDYQPVSWPQKYAGDDTKAHVNSLWQPGSLNFFRDQRARRVGDIVKVTVSIADKAELDNETDRSRQHSDEITAGSILGAETMLNRVLPASSGTPGLLSTDSTNSHSGKGSIAREEKIETEVAAMVTQILPNGNLVIQGDQEVAINFEVRKISVSGIIRPEDISTDNSIDSNMIAEARISYGGRGQITDVQQPRIGNQIIDILSPL